MAYNTGNPIGSNDPRDLSDDIEDVDVWVNDRTKLSHPDRRGVERKTWHGMEQQLNNILVAGGRIFDSEAQGRAAVEDGQYYFAVGTNPEFSRTIYKRISGTTSELIASELAATDDNANAYITAASPGPGIARRPADDRNNYTMSLEGGPLNMRPPVPESATAGGGSGRVLLINSGQLLAQRDLLPLSFAGSFNALVSCGLSVSDPFTGTAQIGVAWYSSQRVFISETLVREEPAPSVGDFSEYRFTFGDDSEHTPPSNARYATVFLRASGGEGTLVVAELYAALDYGLEPLKDFTSTAGSAIPFAVSETAHAFDFTNSFLTAHVGRPVARTRSLSSDAFFENTASNAPVVGVSSGSQLITSPVETAFRASEPLIFSPPCTFVFSHVSMNETSSMAVFQHANNEPGRLQMRCNADAPTGTAEGSFNVFINGASGGSGSGGQPAPAAHGVRDPGVFALVLKKAPERSEFYRNGVLIDTFLSPDVIYQGRTNILGQSGVVSGSGGAIGRLASFNRILDGSELSKLIDWVAESVNAKIDSDSESEIQKPSLITATSGFVAIVRPFDFPQKQGSEIQLYPGFTKRPDAYTRPASLTKVLTSIVMLDHVTDLDDTMTVAASDATGGSGNNLNAGDVISYRDALFNMLLPSSNVTATVVARSVGETIPGDGSPIDKFLQEMNKKAQSLGMRNSFFSNPHGLHVDEMRTTARDIARLGVAALQYEAVLETWGNQQKTISLGGPNARNITVTSSVEILNEERILGGKTGTLSGANMTNNLLVLNKLPGFMFGISVVIGSSESSVRYTDMNAIIDEVERGRRYFPNYLMGIK